MITCGASNCYLLTGDDGSILVDTCGRSAASEVYEKIKSQNIRLILLTHGHPDHAGAAAELAFRLNVPVAVAKEDAQLLADPGADKLHAHTLMGKLLKMVTRMIISRHYTGGTLPSIWLYDRLSLAEYGIDAEVIALPGHTRGSVGVLTSSGDFIVGDAVFNLVRPSGSLVYGDRGQMIDSLWIIARSRAKTLYPGHGKPVRMEDLVRLVAG